MIQRSSDMLMLLSRNSMTINMIAENSGMSRPAISKHIKIMYNAGFISITGIGRERYCTLQQEGFGQVQAFISYFDTFWSKKLQTLQPILNNKTSSRS